MKKIIGIVVIIIGLLLIGYGSFELFEKYDEYLETKNSEFYTGTYMAYDDYAFVQVVDNEKMIITFNDESYEFSYSDGFYENDLMGLVVDFSNDNLVLSKNGEEVKIYYKQKNSIQ